MNELFEDDAPTNWRKDKSMDRILDRMGDTEMPVNKRNYSLRSTEWLDFSSKVFNHIETYTVPQYGDKGEDPCTEYTKDDFVKQIEKYIKRYGKNSRKGQQSLDLLKIAHYAAMLHAKLTCEE